MKHQTGFSLVEAIVALVILATGLLVLGRFQAAKIEDTALSRQHLEAIRLLNGRLEAVKGLWLVRTARNDNADMTCTGGGATFTGKSCYQNYMNATLPTLASSSGIYTFSTPAVTNGPVATASGSLSVQVYKDVATTATWSYKGKSYSRTITLRLGNPAAGANL